MGNVAQYSTGLQKAPDGTTYRIWVMDQAAGSPLCANPTCRKPIESTSGCITLRFPSSKDKDLVDLMCFCCWDCLAMFVSMNDAGVIVAEKLGASDTPMGGDG